MHIYEAIKSILSILFYKIYADSDFSCLSYALLPIRLRVVSSIW